MKKTWELKLRGWRWEEEKKKRKRKRKKKRLGRHLIIVILIVIIVVIPRSVWRVLLCCFWFGIVAPIWRHGNSSCWCRVTGRDSSGKKQSITRFRSTTPSTSTIDPVSDDDWLTTTTTVTPWSWSSLQWSNSARSKLKSTKRETKFFCRKSYDYDDDDDGDLWPFFDPQWSNSAKSRLKSTRRKTKFFCRKLVPSDPISWIWIKAALFPACWASKSGKRKDSPARFPASVGWRWTNTTASR